MSIDSQNSGSRGSRAAGSMRPQIAGTRHAISAGHYLAAQAGFQILEAGGNAVDAGVAAGIALSVVQSDFVNFAGVAPIMIYVAAEKRVVTIDGLGTWPAAASLEFFQQKCGGSIPKGLLRTIVPAAPDAWITALRMYGTLSFADVSAAAIRFAADGFPLHSLMAEIIAGFETEYRTWPSSAAIYLPGGKVPNVGDIFVQSDLAGSIQYMADEERRASGEGREAGLLAARDAFYRGDIASTVSRYHAENGGLLAYDDLAGYRVRVEAPCSARFKDLTIYSCGPWSQGPVLAQMLGIADGLPLQEFGHNSAAYIHAIAETVKLAFADREALYGDPLFVDVPIERLLSREYATERRRLIRDDEAFPGLPPSGVPMRASTPLAARRRETVGASLDTSYVAVIDRAGNAFSATPSDVSTDTPIIPGTGLCPSSRGSQSWVDSQHASCVAPGKRPRLTPNPALAISDEGTLMPFGTPGGDVQCQAMLQVLVNHALFGMDLQEAVEAPRFASLSAPDSFEPHGCDPGRLMLEEELAAAHGDALDVIGHKTSAWPHRTWRAGGVCVVAADPKRGIINAAADPRRPSYALGW